MTWKANVEFKEWSSEMNLRIWRKPNGTDRVEVLQPFQFKSYDCNTKVPDDEIALIGSYFSEDEVTGFLQCMMDAAWSRGMRPTGFADHAHELTAVRAHLSDMRALAFGGQTEVTGAPKIEIAGLGRSS